MWQATKNLLESDRVQHVVIWRDETALTFSEVLSLWNDNAAFRSFFNDLLATAPFSAYRWETPCVTKKTLHRQFEFVLLRSESLERPADETAFAEHFVGDSQVLTFPNLGGTAVMVVPKPVGERGVNNNRSYCHLASFIRNAPDSQRHELWQSVALAMTQRINDRPVWLSTAGMGVAWLHVRLDDRPKYYGYAPYKKSSE